MFSKNVFAKKFTNKPENNDSNESKLALYLIAGYVGIFMFFYVDGPISSGAGLEKRDWLSFLGGYLSFIGTCVVCYFSLLQNKKYEELSEQRKREERFKNIQPIFSVEIKVSGIPMSGTQQEIDKVKQLNIKQFNFTVKNLGKYPVLHIVLFDKYISPSLAPNHSVSFNCFYEYENISIVGDDNAIKLKKPFGNNTLLPPKYIELEYVDADGNLMSHYFSLSRLRDKDVYIFIKQEKL